MKILKVDDTWSIKYDDKDNDRPVAWVRYWDDHSTFSENNAVIAMSYALLEARD